MSSGPEQESNALLDVCLDSLRAEARLFGARVRALVRLDALADASRTRRFWSWRSPGRCRSGS